MVYRILIYLARKEGVAPAQFRHYCENNHIPNFLKIIKPHGPLELTCHYLARVESGTGDRVGATNASKKYAEAAAPVVLIGNSEDFDWDVLIEMKFRDELHFQQYYAHINKPEVAAAMDEDQFADVTKTKSVVIGGTTTVSRDG